MTLRGCGWLFPALVTLPPSVLLTRQASEQGHPPNTSPHPLTPDALCPVPLYPITSTLSSTWSDIPSLPSGSKTRVAGGQAQGWLCQKWPWTTVKPRRWLMGEQRMWTTWAGGVWLRQPCLALGGAFGVQTSEPHLRSVAARGGLEGGSGAYLLAPGTKGRRADPFSPGPHRGTGQGAPR